MRRADRLLKLIQILRRHRRPVTAERIARELEVSERTIYRDIAGLMADHVPIRGEAGIGYVLSPGYDLPPLMFTADEVEALVAGMSWVEARADAGLAHRPQLCGRWFRGHGLLQATRPAIPRGAPSSSSHGARSDTPPAR